VGKRVELDVRLLKNYKKLSPDKSCDLAVNVQQVSPCVQHAKICDPTCSAFGEKACNKDVQLQQLSEWQPLLQHVSHPVLHRRSPVNTLLKMEPQSPPHKEHSMEQNYGGNQPTKKQQNQGINLEQSEQEASTFQVRVRSPQTNGQVAAQLPMWLRLSVVPASGQPSDKSEAPQIRRLPSRKKSLSGPIPARKFMSCPPADILTEAELAEQSLHA